MPKSILPKKLVKTNMCLGKTEIIKRFIYGEGSPSIKTVLPKKLVKSTSTTYRSYREYRDKQVCRKDTHNARKRTAKDAEVDFTKKIGKDKYVSRENGNYQTI